MNKLSDQVSRVSKYILRHSCIMRQEKRIGDHAIFHRVLLDSFRENGSCLSNDEAIETPVLLPLGF